MPQTTVVTNNDYTLTKQPNLPGSTLRLSFLEEMDVSPDANPKNRCTQRFFPRSAWLAELLNMTSFWRFCLTVNQCSVRDKDRFLVSSPDWRHPELHDDIYNDKVWYGNLKSNLSRRITYRNFNSRPASCYCFIGQYFFGSLVIQAGRWGPENSNC